MGPLCEYPPKFLTNLPAAGFLLTAAAGAWKAACAGSQAIIGPIKFLDAIGRLGLFAFRATREGFRRPFEIREITNQIFAVGWRSCPLMVVTGFAFGVVLAMQTRSSMEAFGAEAMIPQAVTYGLFRDVGPLIAALLLSGRVGAGIGAELAGMRVTEQIDAMESLAVDSFKYLEIAGGYQVSPDRTRGFHRNHRNGGNGCKQLCRYKNGSSNSPECAAGCVYRARNHSKWET